MGILEDLLNPETIAAVKAMGQDERGAAIRQTLQDPRMADLSGQQLYQLGLAYGIPNTTTGQLLHQNPQAHAKYRLFQDTRPTYAERKTDNPQLQNLLFQGRQHNIGQRAQQALDAGVSSDYLAPYLGRTGDPNILAPYMSSPESQNARRVAAAANVSAPRNRQVAPAASLGGAGPVQRPNIGIGQPQMAPGPVNVPGLSSPMGQQMDWQWPLQSWPGITGPYPDPSQPHPGSYPDTGTGPGTMPISPATQNMAYFMNPYSWMQNNPYAGLLNSFASHQMSPFGFL